jgi:AcrR family transcriptional regulator
VIESQSVRIARLKRQELLDAAVAELVQTGWRGLRMQAVAGRAGVSRQTVYNAFTGREGLAEAIVEHLTDSFLTGIELSMANGRDPFDQWRAGIDYVLRRGVEDPALRAMLGADSGDDFLELLTSESGPLLATAQARMSVTALRLHPDADPARAAFAAEIFTRLALSNIVRPMHTTGETARSLAIMVMSLLAADAPVRG